MKLYSTGESIDVSYEEPNKVQSTNYLNEEETYSPINKLGRTKITNTKFEKANIQNEYSNEIIFKNDTKQELAKVKFNIDTNILEVTSTGENNDSRILKLELFDSDGVNLKESGEIIASTNADQFLKDLSGKLFDIGDIINIFYEDKRKKVEITNYPSTGRKYNPRFSKNEAFIITKQGLVSYMFESQIILNDSNNEKIIELSFSKIDKKLRVISTGKTTPTLVNNRNYFKVDLNKIGGRKVTGIINSNENGMTFRGSLNMQLYSIGETIDVFCEEPNKVQITNFLNEGETYNLANKLERFKITNTGLKKVDIQNEYPNKIIFKNDNRQELAEVKFNINTKMIEVAFTNENNDSKVLKFELFDSNGTNIKETGEIIANVEAIQFGADLNDKPFNIGDIINISYEDKRKKIEITNYPNEGEKYNPQFSKNEAFIITQQGLVSYIFKNQIILNDNSNQKIIEISLSKIDSRLRIISTGKTTPNLASERDYFKVNLNKIEGKKVIGIIKSNEDGIAFRGSLNMQPYSIGDIIEIFCEKISRVNITNYPIEGKIYNLANKLEKFKITNTGLEKLDISKEYPNEIIFKNDTRQELAEVKFNIDTKMIEVNFTRIKNDSRVLKFELFYSNGTNLKESGEIIASVDATQFRSNLNGKLFNIDDIINISYGDKRKKIEITNYPNKEEKYSPQFSKNEAFIITQQGLVSYIFKSQIILNDNNNEKIIILSLSKIDKKLRVISTGKTTSISASVRDYFKVVLNKIGVRKVTGIIKSNQDGTTFRGSLNMQAYSIGDVIEVFCEKTNKVKITNFPSEEKIYTPTNKLEKFKITNTGLEKVDTSKEYPNEIIFKNDTRQELAEVKFNIDTKMIEVTFTSTKNDSKVLKFELFGSNGANLKESGEIIANVDATQFGLHLNGKAFNIGDIINIFYGDRRQKIEVTNYPNKEEKYNPKFSENEAFIITQQGLVPYIFKSQIILNGNNNQKIVELSLSKIDKKLRVLFTGEEAQSLVSTDDYFRIILNKTSGRNIGRIKVNEDGTNFKKALDMKEYEIGETIDIFCEEPNEVQITNYPNEGKTYTSINKLERFKITDTKFKKVDISNEYPNEIIFKNDTKQELAKIKFNVDKKMLEVSSTGANNDSKILKFELLVSNGTNLKEYAEITESVDATQFGADLNGKPFNINDIINISYEDKRNKIEITNYPNTGCEYSPKFSENEAFTITQKGLVPYIFKSEIILNNNNNEKVIILSLSKIDKKLRVIFTGENAQSPISIDNYFKIILNKINEDKVIGLIKSNEDGANLKKNLDMKEYEIGETIDVFCKEPNKVEITDNPNEGKTYTPINKLTRFKITNTRLQKVEIPKYSNKIKFKNDSNQELARVKFNIYENILEVTSTIENNDDTVLKFELFKSDETTSKASAKIIANENAEQFVADLNGKSFDTDDIINIFYDNKPNKVEIINYFNLGNNYEPKATNNESFIINNNKLIKKYPNEIVLRNTNNEELGMVKFNTTNMTLDVSSTEKIASDNDNFSFKIDSFTGIINPNEDAESFKISLNNVFYSIGKAIQITAETPDKAEITNYQSKGTKYKLKQKKEKFEITDDGLKRLYPNEIIIINKEPRDEVARIKLDVDKKALVVTSTGKIFNFQHDIEIRILDESSGNYEEGILYPNQNANNFVNKLNGKSYDFGYSIRFINPNRCGIITNYPNEGNEYLVGIYQIFFIRETGITQ